MGYYNNFASKPTREDKIGKFRIIVKELHPAGNFSRRYIPTKISRTGYVSIFVNTKVGCIWLKFKAVFTRIMKGTLFNLSVPSSTDRSFQPVPSRTIVLFVVTALPHQVGL